MVQGAFRVQVLAAREAAILAVVNRLLAEKGYDAMTLDAVAAEVGIAKASLYKHFDSKEALAAAAMAGLLDRALAEAERLGADRALDARGRLVETVRWALRAQLAGEMPTLPAENSALRAALVAHRPYLDRLLQLSDVLGAWIVAAQAAGQLDPALPPEVILYTIYARGCDPVLPVLRAGGHSDARIVEIVLQTCFGGLDPRV